MCMGGPPGGRAAAIIVCSAKGGHERGRREGVEISATSTKLPRFIYISKIDEDNGDYNAAFDTLRERFGKQHCSRWSSPSGTTNKKVTGIVDILNKRAYDDARTASAMEIPVPEDKVDCGRGALRPR